MRDSSSQGRPRPAEKGVRVPVLLPFAVSAFRPPAPGAFVLALFHQRACVKVDMLDTDPLVGIANIDPPFTILDHARVGELALSVVDNSLSAVSATPDPLPKRENVCSPYPGQGFCRSPLEEVCPPAWLLFAMSCLRHARPTRPVVFAGPCQLSAMKLCQSFGLWLYPIAVDGIVHNDPLAARQLQGVQPAIVVIQTRGVHLTPSFPVIV